VVVTFGRKVPDGSLPVYSVGTEQEAKELIVLACPTNMYGQYIAPELAQEQTLENLDKFSDRLDKMHEVLKKHGSCRCAWKEKK
jgi:hypothetical protein